MPPRIAKLAALGAFVAVAVFVAVFALIAYAATPRATGGIDWTQAAVAYIAVGLAVLALIALHLIVARGLFALARGTRRGL